jgi:hypothetical protein
MSVASPVDVVQKLSFGLEVMAISFFNTSQSSLPGIFGTMFVLHKYPLMSQAEKVVATNVS